MSNQSPQDRGELKPADALELLVLHTAMEDAATALKCERALKPIIDALTRPQADDAGRRERYARIVKAAIHGTSARLHFSDLMADSLVSALLASDPQPAVVDAEVVARTIYDNLIPLAHEPGMTECRGAARAILSLLNTGGRGGLVGAPGQEARPLDQVPDGWRLAPIEATEAMAMAGATAPRSGATDAAKNTLDRQLGLATDIYRAMLSAAPTPTGAA